MSKRPEPTQGMKLLIEYTLEYNTNEDKVACGALLSNRKIRESIAYSCANHLRKESPYSEWDAVDWIRFHLECAKGLGNR